jgi:hypothetical protein
MKALENFGDVAISDFEMQHFKGGQATQVSGSFDVMGSVLSYSGTLSLTKDGETSASIGIATFSTTNYVSDFCGTCSYDGGSGSGCAQYLNGHWTEV